MDDYEESIGNYFGTQQVHPVGLAVVLALGFAMLFVPRRWAILPMILASCSVSAAQRFVLGGFNFDFLRLMILFGWIRLLMRGELRRFVWNKVDRWLVIFAVLGMAMFCLLRLDGDSVKNRLGWAYDVFGFYFLFRFLFRDDGDVAAVTKSFVIAGVPIAVLFALEFSTHRNLFAVLGGVPEYTWIRDGRLRCQGPFAHPIVAGVYWASVLPLVIALWWTKGRPRMWSIVGVGTVLLIIGTTNSSTPVMAVVFSVGALLLFPLRRWMSFIRWGVVGVLFSLNVIMNSPVWHLISRVNLFDSSTGWHRAHIMDEAFAHFGDWWLAGTVSIANWDDVADMTNEYVATGIGGGLVTLIAFCTMIWCAFRIVGSKSRALEPDIPASLLIWALGASLFGHCMNFIALSYFGQVKMVWYLLLALIASHGVLPRAAVRVPVAPRTAAMERRPRPVARS